VASGSALAALNGVLQTALRYDHGIPETVRAPFEFRTHARYNPAAETSLNIVPGLVGTILTMTMLIFTALSVTREIERGTMESLLSMPIRPVEIMLGKIAPYVVVGGLQMTLILVAAHLLFDVPVVGSLTLLLALTLLFIIANLSVGYTFSTIASNQLQAMQMSFFFFLPSMLLSGFMFPFRGMPVWAQYVGEILPLTHYLRIVRGVMLKGAGFMDLQVEVLALAAFTLAAMSIAVARFRQTLD
jgi:ABC-2 type transport system permease protein